jgi:hypothetical protein
MAIAAPKKKTTTPAAKAAPTSAWSSPISPTNPIFQQSGNDERGRVQNRIVDEQSRYRGQMDPYINTLGQGWGDALEQGQADYGNIMGGLRGLAAGGGNISAGRVGYSDPFGQSYGKFTGMADTGGYDLPNNAAYQGYGDLSRTGGYDFPNNEAYQGYSEFGKTGGYSPNDIADLRARGVAPIRAAYANAQRDVSRQRALQGGYSPNATAVLAKMAREQGQSGSDALQNVNAGIIAGRNQGRLSGMAGMAGMDQSQIANRATGMAGMAGMDQSQAANRIAGMQGMSNIDTQRLSADLDASKSNADLGLRAQQYNQGNALDAYKTMGSLYGTTPGMANMFGDQLGNAIQNSGQQGTSYINAEGNAQQLPGKYENTKQYVTDAATLANPFLEYLKKRPASPTGTGYGGGMTSNGGYTQGAPAGSIDWSKYNFGTR